MTTHALILVWPCRRSGQMIPHRVVPRRIARCRGRGRALPRARRRGPRRSCVGGRRGSAEVGGGRTAACLSICVGRTVRRCAGHRCTKRMAEEKEEVVVVVARRAARPSDGASFRAPDARTVQIWMRKSRPAAGTRRLHPGKLIRGTTSARHLCPAGASRASIHWLSSSGDVYMRERAQSRRGGGKMKLQGLAARQARSARASRR